MEGTSESVLSDVSVESDVQSLNLDPPMARVRFRLGSSFPAGDWLNVTVTARLFDPAEARRGRFEEPLAAGPEVPARARSNAWSVVDVALPHVVRREYALVGKVFSADPRYRKPFSPSDCHVVTAMLGGLVRMHREVLEDVYERGGYGNPAAEDEIKRWVRDGAIVAVDPDGQLWRPIEKNGQLAFEPLKRS